MHFTLAVWLVFLPTFFASAQTLTQEAASHSSPKLELRLFAAKSTIRPGERVKLRVELWNVGSNDVIIAQNLDSTFGNSALSLILQTGLGGESHGDVGDRIPEPSEPDFEETFLTNWLTLNKNHFYGTYVYMDPIDFPHLRKPGRYEVSAQYYSRGISSTPGWNGAFLRQADIDKLPLAAFQGSINSDVVTIRVLPRKNANKK